MSQDSKTPQVKCPSCGTYTLYSSANIHRPFCSERCKMIDLGEWAKESYRIPDPHTLVDDAEDQYQLQ